MAVTVSSSKPVLTNCARSVALLGEYAQGAVARVHNLARGRDDLAQQNRKAEVAGQRDNRVEQAAHPLLGAGHLLGAVDELPQQVVEAGTRMTRPDAFGLVHARVVRAHGGRSLVAKTAACVRRSMPSLASRLET